MSDHWTAEGRLETALRIVIGASIVFVVGSVYVLGLIFGAW